MKKRILLTAIVALGLVLPALHSCKKESTQPQTTDTDTQTAEDNALAEGSYSDAYNMIDGVQNGNQSGYFKKQPEDAYLSSCATVSIDTTSSPRKITIDFGTTGCLCKDGRTRSGKVIATYTGRYRATGTVITITFDNYYVNGHKVEGTKTVTNMGLNSAGNMHFKIEVNGKITKANNGGIITWTSTRDREWVAGSNTFDIFDDVYHITGTASGTNAKGVNYTLSIDPNNPLEIKIGCKHIVKGKLTITPQGKADRVIDYGNGDCDDQATVTINGKVYNITLK